MNKMQSFILTVFSAALLVAAYPQTGWWLLAWIGLVPLLLAINGKKSIAGFWLSFLTGYLFFIGTLGWLVHVTYPGTFLLCAYLSLYVGFFALAYQFFAPLSLIPRMLTRAAAWTVLEYTRSYLFTGFGWSLLGHSQCQNLWFVQMADITGVYGISFCIVLVNLLIAETIYCCVIARSVFQRRSNPLTMTPSCNDKSLIIAWVMTAVLVMSAVGYGLWQLNTPRHWPTVKVGVIQPNIPQGLKWLPQMRTLIVDKHIELTHLFHDQALDLVVWPETSLPGITSEAPDLVQSIKNTTQHERVPILYGAITQDGDRYYNSALLLSKQGQSAGQYDKIHLVPFGEFLPLRPILGWINHFIGVEDFASGTRYQLFDVGSHPKSAGVLICFEDTLGDLRRHVVDAGAQFWINMTNDAWFGDTKEPFMHLQAAVIGCIENKRALVRSANTGFSGFIDPFGRIFSVVENAKGKKTFIAGVAMAEVPLVDTKTFYTKYADLFTFICFLGILWAILLLTIRKRHA